MLNKNELFRELQFKATRSSGAGGQHVNKVSTKIELSFDLESSNVLTETQKTILKQKLASKLTKENVLILFCDETRSQHKNKELIVKRFFSLLEVSLKKTKKRKATRPTRAAIEKRIENKQHNSAKKALRKKPRLD